MLREGTWFIRHVCCKTQVHGPLAPQFSAIVFCSQVQSRTSTAYRFSGFGRLPAFSALAEQEDTSDFSIDCIPASSGSRSLNFGGHHSLQTNPSPSTRRASNPSLKNTFQRAAIVQARTVPYAPIGKPILADIGPSAIPQALPTVGSDNVPLLSSSKAAQHPIVEPVDPPLVDTSTIQLFESSITDVIQNRQYHQAIELFQDYALQGKRMEDSTQPPVPKGHVTTSVIDCYLEALVHLGRMRQVEDAITLFDSSVNRQPSRRTYAILLKAYIQSLNLRKARLLLFEMIARGVKIDNEIVHIILRGEGQWAVSLESVDSLLDLLCSHELEFRDMTSYNLIIDAYLRRDRPDKARGVLDKVLKSDLHPDAGTFHALMRYQARKEGSRGVRSVLNSMMKSGIRPETRHLNILISRLAREQHVDMTATVKTMSSHDLVPDTATCNIVLRELLRRKFDANRLQAHFDSMESLNIQPDAFTFTVLLNEYKRKNRRWQRAQKLLRDQLSLNPEYVNRVTNNVVLHHMMSNFTKSRPFVEIVQSNEFQLQWDLRTITHLLVAYSKSGDWSKILDLYRKLDKRLVKLDRRFYRVLLRALLQGKHYSESIQVASSLYASDDMLDQLFGRECKIRISYAILRDTRRGGNNVATDIDNFLKYSDRKGVMITEKHCNLIAVAFLCANRAELAIELLESRYNAQGRFQDIEHCELGMSAWTILMRAYARKGRGGVQGLRSCVSRALLKGSQPPTRTFLNFLHHLGVNKKLRAANPTDCDFFLQTYNECVERSKKRRRNPRPRGRQYLTKTSILMWVNRVDAKELMEKLGKKSVVRG